jgi:hypothetical protein
MDAKYYGFDLDNTIGNFEDDGYLDWFHIEGASNKLNATLKKAYDIFVNKVVIHIHKTKIFNPLILKLIIENNVSNSVIYSNNSNLDTLVFAKNVIEKFIGHEVFCFLMHWGHRFRTTEIVKGDPGNALKRWVTLKRGFREGCGIKGLKPEQVYFYDDQRHQDLMKELGDRYNNIKSYEADINVEFVNNLALKSIEEIGLFDDEEYDSYYDIVKMKSRINGKKKIISNK